ncbi:hypothetical protein [Corallococcus caeni]|uniref:Uncharacterized protein n=1 Tax=Corallococcus caeni TaxID=3082388 RepID=A0ABQ6QIS9_9BACT|nr:hypothetical protein ASNO1_00090 [Corallococcus sp. NO1]
MKKKLMAVVLAVFVTSPAYADEIDDRVRTVDDYLSRIKDKLDGIVSDSSSSDIDHALDSLSTVRENVEKLKSLDPQNDPGKYMASYYPDWISRFRESVQYLKRMKDAQVKADDSRLSERCNEAGRSLRSFMQEFVDKKDPNGLYRIPDEAEKVGRTYGDELKKMQDLHYEMERWKGSSRSFSESHGRWSDVKSELHDGANDIWDRWNRRMEETKYKCQELAKGKDWEPVKEALSKLGNFGQVRVVIRKKLDEKLQTVASQLRDLDAKSGDAASEIQAAQRSVDDLLGFLGELKEIQGEDREARELADRWPTHARALKESIDAYKKLKAGQNYFDADLKTCDTDVTEFTRFLAEKVSAEAKKNPKESANEIRTRAEPLQKKWQGMKSDADKLTSEMSGFRDRVNFSFRDGEWSRVVDALQGSAAKSLASFNVKRAQLYENDPCRQLQFGVLAKAVVDALKLLGEHRGTIVSRYEATKVRFWAWKKDAQDFRWTVHLQSKELRQAICDDADWDKKLQQMADANASRNQSRFDDLLSRRDQILGEVDLLIRDSKDVSLLPFRRKVVEYLNPLLPLREWDLKGYGNPYISTRVERGKQEHQNRQRNYKVKELEFPCSNPVTGGSWCRLDYMDGCTIVEIKPRNKGALEQGYKQLKAYKQGLEDMYKQQGKAMFAKNFAELAKCESNGELKLGTKIDDYDFCPSDEAEFTAAKAQLDLNLEPPALDN